MEILLKYYCIREKFSGMHAKLLPASREWAPKHVMDGLHPIVYFGFLE